MIELTSEEECRHYKAEYCFIYKNSFSKDKDNKDNKEYKEKK